MNKNNKKTIILVGILILIVIAILALILLNTKKGIKEKNKVYEEKITLFEELDTLSSWVTYWDLNADREIMELDNKLSSLSYFAANFNDSNELVIPDKLIKYYNDTKQYNFKKYITIVNDIVHNDGTSSVKDIEVLSKVLRDENSRKNHIKEIIDLATEYGFNGIEVDYEQIKDDMGLWNEFLLFIKELYNEAINNNLELRVLLEPNSPIDKLNFIEGPTYVMMCYNLHGSFSKPGEKANEKFIQDLIEKMESINSKKAFAIATGGFDWEEGGRTKAVSEIEANKIKEKYNVDVNRDDNSKYLYFNYIDKNNVKHEVWYGDKVTLKYLYNPIIESGYDVNIWRLGGNLFN